MVNSDNYGEVFDDSNPLIPRFFQDRKLSLNVLKRTYVTWESVLADVSLPTLTWGNHDISRVLDRLNLPNRNINIMKLLAMMLFLQRGIPVIYYGEEIGMHGLKYKEINNFNDQRALDLIKNLRQKSFDDATILKLLNNQDEMTARGPMQWDTSKYRGFSTKEPWNWAQTDDSSVDQELVEPKSIITFYKELLRIKKHDCFTIGDYQLLITDPQIYAYIRRSNSSNGFVLANFSDQKVTFSLPTGKWRKVLTNQTIKITDSILTVGPWGCCALESKF